MTQKICSQCDVSKSIDNFYFRKKNNCYEGKCRKCKAENARKRRADPKKKKAFYSKRKEYYQKNKKMYNERCKKYHKKNRDKNLELMKDYYQENKEHLKNKASERRRILKEKALNGKLKKPDIKTKTCTGCKKEKDVSQFTFRKTRNVYDSKCKRCNTERERERRRLHKDKINARRKEIKKPLTPEQKITVSLRCRVNGYIENREGRNLYLKLLGCNKLFLLKWFEYNFELDEHLEMKWENHGDKWHIDHVTPCASFDMTDKKQQLVCFHWTNLSPVLKPYNLSKGSKIVPKDEERQKQRVKNFLDALENNKKYKYSIINHNP